MPWAKLTTRRMPNTKDRPAETRKRSPASASEFSTSSTTTITRGAPALADPLAEVLRVALWRDLVTGVRGEDLGDQVRVLRILHRLHGEPRLHRLVIALAHEERPLEPFVARVLPR